jgi:hypothetical protein
MSNVLVSVFKSNYILIRHKLEVRMNAKNCPICAILKVCCSDDQSNAKVKQKLTILKIKKVSKESQNDVNRHKRAHKIIFYFNQRFCFFIWSCQNDKVHSRALSAHAKILNCFDWALKNVRSINNNILQYFWIFFVG